MFRIILNKEIVIAALTAVNRVMREPRRSIPWLRYSHAADANIKIMANIFTPLIATPENESIVIMIGMVRVRMSPKVERLAVSINCS